ncbi:flagellar assembly protein FliH [Arsukibacterium tuosuense]|uniref:Flagellar assembly protein FliH n=1 Tax=Arsukibacterium tuosuense TaxID=1323745 RepID=A0A285J9P1_9GAMM|nr:flagellar assembly protein FliH [Arsukibacterium tuosuense]SNY56086.1 flagellar assembly protein FliH [Arsukibacterium tuosuense]
MTKTAYSRNRPYSPDPDASEQVKHWHTPDLTADARSQDTRTNALNMHLPEATAAAAEEQEQELVIKPLTADDIEQMRQAAHDEGILQGKEEGFAKGYSEGREQGQQDGFKQGQAEGKRQGLEDGATELDTLRAELSVLLDQLQQPLAKIDNRVEQELLQLCLAMAKAVINVEVTTNPKVILQALQEAVSALPLQSSNLIIKLNPADVASVKRHYNDTELTERGWQLRPEPLVEQGGCLVESISSSVDRSLNQRIQSSLEHFLQLAETADSSEHAAAESSDIPTQQAQSNDAQSKDAQSEHSQLKDTQANDTQVKDTQVKDSPPND